MFYNTPEEYCRTKYLQYSRGANIGFKRTYHYLAVKEHPSLLLIDHGKNGLNKNFPQFRSG